MAEIDESGSLEFEDDIVHIDGEGGQQLSGSDADDHKAEFDNEAYGKNVRRRINKLTYEREVEKTERLRLEAQLKATEDKIKALEEKFGAINQQTTQNSYASQVAELREQRRTALIAEDYDEMDRIDEQLLDIRFKQRDQERQPIPQQQNIQQPQNFQPPQPTKSAAAMEWEARNAAWIAKPENQKRLEAVNQVYMQMLENEMYEADDPATYEELDRRMERVRVRPPVNAGGGIDRGGEIQPANGTVRMTAQDREKMIGFGLDPNNPVERTAWLQEKARTARASRGY